ncbi:hypothetical protein [Azospirillum sp. ST 5-10]|uniref:hypothetical protein n=1 Tax=unclassified Azospirillum TaxID=2630922 RepID=UPI003F4A5AF0
MIDRELLSRYHAAFGETFTVMLWAQRPGDAVNGLMRSALAGNGPPVTDERVAAGLVARSADGSPPHGDSGA